MDAFLLLELGGVGGRDLFFFGLFFLGLFPPLNSSLDDGSVRLWNALWACLRVGD